METGVNGVLGMRVLNHVMVGTKPEPGHVITHPRQIMATFVLEMKVKNKNATLIVVLVSAFVLV